MAVISLLFGMVLLFMSLVRYVIVRDMQRLEPTLPLRDVQAVVGLLAAGAALAAGGAAALARWSRPALMLLAGVILLGAAGVLYLFACDARWQEQVILDRRWEEAASRASRRFPPALPGGRPTPAALRGVPLILGLLAGGVVLCGGGLVAINSRPGPKSGHR
jgi:hypothetical protein